MGKLAALRPNAVEIRARTRVEIDFDGLVLAAPECRIRRISLGESAVNVRDAQLSKRFVRHMSISFGAEQLDLVTPPEEGTIAPRCARLPEAPLSSLIVDRPGFDILDRWHAGGGSLRARTIAELAQLATLATSSFAVHVGERAAQLAMEMTSDVCGPFRGCSNPRQLLAPLVDAAQRSERASEALVAALARSWLVA